MNQQIYVFCGPDMCGKTQISKEWSNIKNIPYFKASSEHETYLEKKDKFINQLKFADTRMVDFLSQTKHSVIFDRAWPCEFAYSKVFNRQTDLNILKSVDSAYSELNTNIILCYRSSYKGIIDDLDSTINSDKLLKIEQAYREFLAFTKCKYHILNVDDNNLQREIDDLKKVFGN
jgi:hypothetical protein